MKKKYFFTNQISNKFKSIEEFPEWLANYPDFKDQIKLIRETLGMTQKQLAKKVYRTLRTIQHIESGETKPKISTLSEIANALNTELKITLIPRQNIVEFLNEKAFDKASQLVNIDAASSALEVQSPSDEEDKEQTMQLQKEILERKRESLWNQSRIKK